ncbi:MAG: Fis family transcriptional regulator [Myxococcales bacterium]|nr:Fis family transcriptional regulator [Myxococcales bacterium]
MLGLEKKVRFARKVVLGLASGPMDPTLTDFPGRKDGLNQGVQFILRIVDSPLQSLVDFRMPVHGPVVLGRAPEGGVALPITDPRISGTHARIEPGGEDHVVVTDCGSKNGTFVNGLQIEQAKVKLNDMVRVGSTLLVLSRMTNAVACEEPNHSVIGDGPDFRELCAHVSTGARSNLPILLLGETGTGKEVFANMVHRKGGQGGNFVPVNCAAIPKDLVDSSLFGHEKGAFTGATEKRPGFFREAHLGTLFLDEIGDLPLEVQPRLLRAIEQGEVMSVGSSRPTRVETRLVAATNVDLEGAMGDGTFRADLFARLTGWTVEPSPLRSRREDILRLGRFFLGRRPDEAAYGEPLWDADLAEALVIYPWPYNIRELRQVMEQLLATRTGSLYTLDDAPEKIADAFRRSRNGLDPAPTPTVKTSAPAAADESTVAARPRTPDREALLLALEQNDYNVSAVGRLFQRDRKQVYRWMRRHNIEPKD